MTAKKRNSPNADNLADAQLHWQCVAICIDHRRYGLKAIERHRLNQFIALHRAGRKISKPQRYAVMQVIAVCKARGKKREPVSMKDEIGRSLKRQSRR